MHGRELVLNIRRGVLLVVEEQDPDLAFVGALEVVGRRGKGKPWMHFANGIGEPEEHRTEVSRRWLESARRYASQLDPLGKPDAVARDLELPEELLATAIAELKGRGAGPK